MSAQLAEKLKAITGHDFEPLILEGERGAADAKAVVRTTLRKRFHDDSDLIKVDPESLTLKRDILFARSHYGVNMLESPSFGALAFQDALSSRIAEYVTDLDKDDIQATIRAYVQPVYEKDGHGMTTVHMDMQVDAMGQDATGGVLLNALQRMSIPDVKPARMSHDFYDKPLSDEQLQNIANVKEALKTFDDRASKEGIVRLASQEAQNMGANITKVTFNDDNPLLSRITIQFNNGQMQERVRDALTRLLNINNVDIPTPDGMPLDSTASEGMKHLGANIYDVSLEEFNDIARILRDGLS